MEVHPTGNTDITILLQAWGAGDKSAEDQLWPIIFPELKKLARRQMVRERPDHTLQTVALINEAYVRLVAWDQAKFENRAQFFRMCARMMRQILVEYARARQCKKRPQHLGKVDLDDVVLVSKSKDEVLIALDEALRELAIIHPRKSEVVVLRFFGGLSVEETAELLEISRLTVIRDWNFARAWLRLAIDGKSI
jgi:RNA polymerase sigma factor (TIGR02999 family)